MSSWLCKELIELSCNLFCITFQKEVNFHVISVCFTAQSRRSIRIKFYCGSLSFRSYEEHSKILSRFSRISSFYKEEFFVKLEFRIILSETEKMLSWKLKINLHLVIIKIKSLTGCTNQRHVIFKTINHKFKWILAIRNSKSLKTDFTLFFLMINRWGFKAFALHISESKSGSFMIQNIKRPFYILSNQDSLIKLSCVFFLFLLIWFITVGLN